MDLGRESRSVTFPIILAPDLFMDFSHKFVGGHDIRKKSILVHQISYIDLLILNLFLHTLYCEQ